MPRDISSALLKCQEYAKNGYELADNGCKAIMETLEKERKRVSATEQSQARLKRGEWSNADVLRRQKRELEKFSRETKQLQRDLERLHESQKEFTVLVFGRTMVGKSTLMEILTHGEGKSIGNGTQRTTRDVRDYHWNGLKVIDVPGIASFDGKEDDDLALAAAKSADLIMFLISDDGVQAEEAKHLASLLSMGKPVLGLINIKVGIADEPRSVDIRRIAKKMGESERIEEICNQFRAYANMYEQNWNDLTFVHTHLKAAYVGQDKNEELWKLSNFEAVEEYLLEKVERDGAFLRIKTFVDNVAKPMQNRLEDIVASSSMNLMLGFEYRKKYNDLQEWRDAYFDRTQNKYYDFMDRLKKKVANGIYDFAERNYDNENAGKDWKNYLINDIDIEGECEKFIQNIRKDFKRKQRELVDDFSSDASYYLGSVDTENIMGESVTDTELMRNIAIGIGAILGPVTIGWGIALGIANWLFSDSKEEKVRKRKSELRGKLDGAMNPVLDEVGDKLVEVLNNILHKDVDGLINTLDNRCDIMLNLVAEEQSMAIDMQAELAVMNLNLWGAADTYLGLTSKEDNLIDIARIPGKCIYAFGNKKYKDEDIKALSNLLVGEFNYIEINEEERKGLYWWDTLKSLFNDNIYIEDIDYGEDEKLWVYNITDYDSEINKKWEYSIMQQLDPMPVF